MTHPPTKAPFELPQTEAAAMQDLHNAIMNIPAVPPEDANVNQIMSYKVGHRDARHAAAELALSHPAAQAGAVPEGDWLWCKLMDFCKKRGFAPASFDDLFTIVGEARALAATLPSAAPGDGQGKREVMSDVQIDALLASNGWLDEKFHDQVRKEQIRNMFRQTLSAAMLIGARTRLHEGSFDEGEKFNAWSKKAGRAGSYDAWAGWEARAMLTAPAALAAPGAAIAAREQEGYVWLKCDGCGKDMRSHDSMGHCLAPDVASATPKQEPITRDHIKVAIMERRGKLGRAMTTDDFADAIFELIGGAA